MNAILKTGLVFLALSVLFLGIKVDDEFADHNLFKNTNLVFKCILNRH